MIICHCQSISDHDIRAAVGWMRAADADGAITPGRIYRALGKRADCGGCLPLFLATLDSATGRIARDSATTPILRRGLTVAAR